MDVFPERSARQRLGRLIHEGLLNPKSENKIRRLLRLRRLKEGWEQGMGLNFPVPNFRHASHGQLTRRRDWFLDIAVTPDAKQGLGPFNGLIALLDQ